MKIRFFCNIIIVTNGIQFDFTLNANQVVESWVYVLFFQQKKHSFFVLFVISIIAATSVSHFICNVNIEDEKTKKKENYA